MYFRHHILPTCARFLIWHITNHPILYSFFPRVYWHQQCIWIKKQWVSELHFQIFGSMFFWEVWQNLKTCSLQAVAKELNKSNASLNCSALTWNSNIWCHSTNTLQPLCTAGERCLVCHVIDHNHQGRLIPLKDATIKSLKVHQQNHSDTAFLFCS